jgi:hypothetical protein
MHWTRIRTEDVFVLSLELALFPNSLPIGRASTFHLRRRIVRVREKGTAVEGINYKRSMLLLLSSFLSLTSLPLPPSFTAPSLPLS